jgi:hypothetical protein
MSSPAMATQAITWQNQVLSDEIASLKGNNSTDAARVRFINQSLSFYYSLNFYLFFIYVALGIIAMFVVFFRKPWSAPAKFVVLLLVAAYPFVIITVEYGLRYIISFVYSLFNGSVYLDPYYEHQPFSLSNLFSFSTLI